MKLRTDKPHIEKDVIYGYICYTAKPNGDYVALGKGNTYRQAYEKWLANYKIYCETAKYPK